MVEERIHKQPLHRDMVSPTYCLLTEPRLISCRFGFATVLSVYNKWMFSADKFGFPSPLFVTSMHMIMQFLLAALARLLFPSTFGSPYSPNLKQYG